MGTEASKRKVPTTVQGQRAAECMPAVASSTSTAAAGAADAAAVATLASVLLLLLLLLGIQSWYKSWKHALYAVLLKPAADSVGYSTNVLLWRQCKQGSYFSPQPPPLRVSAAAVPLPLSQAHATAATPAVCVCLLMLLLLCIYCRYL
jgi:hypothetical protein